MRFQTLYEGRWIFAILLILAVASAFLSTWLTLILVGLILYTFAFFRDPNRPDPADQRAVVAAADGTVADIEEIDEKEFLKARTKRVGIFLSIFDVHTNRAPVAGRIEFQQFRKGLFFDARRPECSEKNEAMTWAFQNPRATIVVRQLTGAIARRIVGWAKVGDELKRGDRFGMIRFGSRTEVYLPLDAEVLVKVGDHVKGGRECDRTIAGMNEDHPKIYLLPNLMTAGNLFCGFTATLKIVQGALIQWSSPDEAAILFHAAVWFILGACIFDVLDGRLARLGGQDSSFGREFDSLADIVSFGVAPALLVYRIVLINFPRVGWIVAFVYLVCGALRLARFNTMAANGAERNKTEFTGFPIPAAAGLIASITFFMLWWFGEKEHDIGRWKWVLPPLMLFLSVMMFTRLRYPSFKAITWRTTRSLPRFAAIILILFFTALNYEWMPAILFLAYLLYGFLRPWVSKRWRREIEEEIGEESENGEAVEL